MPTKPQDLDSLLMAAAYRSMKRNPVANSRKDRADFEAAQAHIRRLVEPTEGSQPATGIEKALFLYAVEKSLASLAGYASLNYEHMSTLVVLQAAVETYHLSTSLKNLGDIRPENWLITSNPGEGKSHLVSCIAKAPALKDKVSLVSFNMASMRTADDLIQALDEVRNVAITGKLPMLFLDEVDDKEGNFGLLLPLLWDGEIQVGVRRIRIGRAVIVAAGSKPYLVDRIKNQPPPDSKFQDFRSRMKFDAPIPPLEPNYPGGIDQVCIAIAVLRHMYKDDKGSEVLAAPVSLLNFIYSIKFSYGVRSIKHLIDSLGTGDKSQDIKDGVLNIKLLSEALDNTQNVLKSGLLAHIKDTRAGEKGTDAAQAEFIVNDWKRAVECGGTATAPIWCKSFRGSIGEPSTWPEDRAPFYNTQLLLEMCGEEVQTFVGAGIDGVGVLYFFPGRGEWKHGNEQLRHIFFNLRTIATIIHCLKKDEFHSVGFRMGTVFGEDFLKSVESLKFEEEDVSKKLDTLIKEWCKFDISGGWGHWNSVLNEITVKNSFFVEMDKKDPEKSKIMDKEPAHHCVIMEGYIAGVLEAFSAWLGVHDQFDVKEAKCGIHDIMGQKKETECTFTWNKKESASPGKTNLPPPQ